MTLGNTPQDNAAMAFHFSTLDWIDGERQTSGFVANLQEARRATQRDPDTGRKSSGGHYGSWLGALGYMVLLDQIGSCFKPRNPSRSTSSSNTFEKALIYFTDLRQEEIDALYALRCAFAHDFSLYNIRTVGKVHKYNHHFLVGQGADGSIVGLPQQQWDGTRESRSPDNMTTVNLERFGDLVEDICARLVNLFRNQGLKLALDGGADELRHRYFFGFRRW